MSKSNQERKEFISFIITLDSPSLKEVSDETQAGDLETGTGTEAMEECTFLLALHGLLSLLSYITQGQVSMGDNIHMD